MATDPVCGMQVDERNSPTSNYQGTTYAFCGIDCKSQFDKKPEQYANAGGVASQKRGQSQTGANKQASGGGNR